MRWDGSPESAAEVQAFINANGGEARYEPAMTTTIDIDEGRPPHTPPRIVITGPNGPVYCSPGDSVVLRDGEWSVEK